MLDIEATKRFWDKVNKDAPNGCWEWTGALNNMGYGNVNIGGKNYLAHRLSYQLIKGDIPKGLVLDHLCRNTKCVNPEHLDPVTHKENILRGVGPIPKNAHKTHCCHGHLYDEKNTYYDKKGRRHCRACNRERAKVNREKLRKENQRGGNSNDYR